MNDELVNLDRDHPGFRDLAYRARRNAIASQANVHQPGRPVGDVAYTEQEHQVWAHVLEKLAPLHQRYACREFRECWPALAFPVDRVPQLGEASRTVAAKTRFTMEPVAGLVGPRAFMSALGRRIFLATQYMRHHSMPLYTPEPDVIHELVGHAALLAHPGFAEVNRLFGVATDAAGDDRIEALIRVYWYALEFGAVKSADGLQVVGAGLLSSFGELGRFETAAMLRPFDVADIAATPFDPTDYQKVIFVAESTPALLDGLRRFLSTFL